MARIVHGNHPFNVPKDQPMRIGHEQFGYFTYPDMEFLGSSDLNCLFVSTDKITMGYYEFQPGGQFDPPDHHPGDECYYILEGQLTETNCYSGQACILEEDDVLLIPNGAAHGGHNFGNRKMKAVFALAPNMVEPGTQTFPTDLAGKVRVLKGQQEKDFEHYDAAEEKKYIGTIDRLGNWPVADEELRVMPKYLHVNHPNDRLNIVVGEKNPYLMRFAFSTKDIQFGELVLPVGGHGCRISDPESHKGQSVFYVKSGCLCFIITETRETFKLYPGEVMYIPENCEYQMMNYEAEAATAVFAISEL